MLNVRIAEVGPKDLVAVQVDIGMTPAKWKVLRVHNPDAKPTVLPAVLGEQPILSADACPTVETDLR